MKDLCKQLRIFKRPSKRIQKEGLFCGENDPRKHIIQTTRQEVEVTSGHWHGKKYGAQKALWKSLFLLSTEFQVFKVLFHRAIN